MEHFEIKGMRFLLWWVVASIFVYPVAVMLVAVTMMPLSIFWSFLSVPSGSDLPGPLQFFIGIGIVMLIGAIIGYAVGQLQRWLLRSHLYWTAEHWRSLSVAGGAIGAVLVLGVMMMAERVFASDYILILAMPFYVMAVSLAQWISLREAVRSAILWVFANVVAGIVYGGLLMMNEPSVYAPHYTLSMLSLMLLAMIAQGVITGFVMLWLFEKHSYEVDNGTATKPAATSSDSSPSGGSSSIWDQAI